MRAWTRMSGAVLSGALLAATVGSALVATPASATTAPTFSSPCFTSPKIQQTGTYTVPATGVSTVRAVLRGQNGRPGGYGHPSKAGGLGATLVVEVPVAPGQTLRFGKLGGAPGGTSPGGDPGIGGIDGYSLTGYRGGDGGDAHYLSTLGADGCQHALAVAGAGGGGSGYEAVGGNADAGAGATAGANGGQNTQRDGGGGGGAGVGQGGTPGHKGYYPIGCLDGNHGRWGVFLNDGDGGNAAPPQTQDVNCRYPSHGGGGGGAGYWYGGGGGSPYSGVSSLGDDRGVTNAAGGGGGGSTYVDPSVTKLSLSAGALAVDPVVVPVYQTAVSLVASPNPSYSGKAVTITARATVLGTDQAVVAGTFGIYVSGALFATVPVGANGEATLTTTALPTGDIELQARFFATTTEATMSQVEAYRDGLASGSQVVHPCAPAPSFTLQPINLTRSVGDFVGFVANVSVAPVFGGIPEVVWQTSADGGTTWTNVASTVFIDTDSMPTGTAQVYMTFSELGDYLPAGVLKYRAVATTCGGTTASSSATLTVEGIDFDLSALPAKTYGDAAFDISGYASASNVSVSFSSPTPSVCTVASPMVTLRSAGTCIIYANPPAGTTDPPPPGVEQSFTVTKKTITVVAGSPPDQPQGTATAPIVTCTSSDFVDADTFVTPPIGRVYLLDPIGLWRPQTITANSPARTYTTRCTGGDPGGSYTIGEYVNGTFTIGPPAPPPLTITANSKSYTYGTPPPALDVAYSVSGATLAGTTSCNAYAKSDTAYVSPIALSDTTPVVAGGYAIRCTGLTSSSHTLKWVDGTLTVNPAPVTVTASSPPTQTHGATSAPSVTCSATGFVGSDSFLTDPTGAVYDSSGTNQVSIGSTTDVGEYVTKCTDGDPGSNYTFSGHTAGTFTVEDTTAPVVTVPANTTLEATGPDGAVATFTAVATDAVDGLTGATCAPASGSAFAIGTTTVTCTSTDAAGNTGSADFTVTVEDTTAPVVTVPANTTLEATGPDGAVATFSAEATDAVDGQTGATCTPASGSAFAIGTTTVTCSSTDAAGNTGSADFTVTVTGVGAQLTALLTDVKDLPVDPKTSKNLQSILQNAQTAIAKGNMPAACDKLTSFVSQVRALSGKKIATPTADRLLVDAWRIMAVLGCS